MHAKVNKSMRCVAGSVQGSNMPIHAPQLEFAHKSIVYGIPARERRVIEWAARSVTNTAVDYRVPHKVKSR